MAASAVTSGFRFGQHQCNKTNLFYATKLSYGFVNLKPVVPCSFYFSSPYSLCGPLSHLTSPLKHIPLASLTRYYPYFAAELTFNGYNCKIKLETQLYRFSVHVLVIPKRHVLRYADLTVDEITDLWVSSQRFVTILLRPKKRLLFNALFLTLFSFFSIGATLEKHADVGALTFVVQDGKDAGQTVQHVHVHIMPRRAGDFKRNDDIYDELERVDAESRRPRTVCYIISSHSYPFDCILSLKTDLLLYSPKK